MCMCVCHYVLTQPVIVGTQVALGLALHTACVWCDVAPNRTATTCSVSIEPVQKTHTHTDVSEISINAEYKSLALYKSQKYNHTKGGPVSSCATTVASTRPLGKSATPILQLSVTAVNISNTIRTQTGAGRTPLQRSGF